MRPIVKQALLRAMDLHRGQTRKDGVTPYIVHPVQAAIILARSGADDETLAAALLHDTVEDTPYTAKQLTLEFGKTVAEMVLACSENKGIVGWDERKGELFARLAKASKNAKRVKAADAFANMLDLIEPLTRTRGGFWKKFRATPRQKLADFEEVLALCASVLPHAMKSAYRRTLGELRRFVKA